jgi:hypothetical protein
MDPAASHPCGRFSLVRDDFCTIIRRDHARTRVPLTQTSHIPDERRTPMKRVGLWMIGIGPIPTLLSLAAK